MDGIEKSVPRDHRLSSLGKPRDANRRSFEPIFYLPIWHLKSIRIYPECEGGIEKSVQKIASRGLSNVE